MREVNFTKLKITAETIKLLQAQNSSTGDSLVAKQIDGINKSEEVRKLLKANPAVKAKEVVATLAERGIDISANLFYLVKGDIHGRKAHKKKGRRIVAKVAETTGAVDAVATILKVKTLASELGGMKKLKALVEALSE